jgi:hypothetical protein
MWTEEDLARLGYRLVGETAVREVPHDRTRETLPSDTPEDRLLARIRALAKQHGWLTYHTQNSRKSETGFPDLCLAKAATATSAGRLILAELKSRTGKVSQAQYIWLDVLAHTIPGLEVYLWRPSDLPEIVAILTRT